jgi:hypothetical protein
MCHQVLRVQKKGTLDAAGIEMPYPTETLRPHNDLEMNDDRSE